MDRLSFVIQKRLKLFFVDEVRLMSKEQRALVWQEPLKPNCSAKQIEASDDITLVATFSVKGLVSYDLVTGSFNSSKYLVFLQKLRNMIGQESIGLFYDGISVHKSSQVQKALQQNSWVRLLNVAYSQEDNPAEYLLNDIKHAFRNELLRAASMRGQGYADGQMSPEVIIAKVLGQVQKQECEKVILRCLGQMIAKYGINLESSDMKAWLDAQ